MDNNFYSNGLTLVALVLMFTMGINILKDSGFLDIAAVLESEAVVSKSPSMSSQGGEGEENQTLTIPPLPSSSPTPSADQFEIIPPYEYYTITQGLHGYAYGHMAIDISAGKGVAIRSPINGVVTELYIDQLGNTILVIENEVYRITMAHGIYSVKVGDQVVIGQPVGIESNQGNTVDGLGQSCRGRDCGYHTHINIFDKRLGVNVNPLEVFNH